MKMKKSVISTLVAGSLLSLSSLTFAAEPAQAEPMLLTASEMDNVTAAAGAGDFASIFQWNISPVTVVQINVLSNGVNIAEIVSGNYSGISQ
jgi:hypothetical protein